MNRITTILESARRALGGGRLPRPPAPPAGEIARAIDGLLLAEARGVLERSASAAADARPTVRSAALIRARASSRWRSRDRARQAARRTAGALEQRQRGAVAKCRRLRRRECEGLNEKHSLERAACWALIRGFPASPTPTTWAEMSVRDDLVATLLHGPGDLAYNQAQEHRELHERQRRREAGLVMAGHGADDREWDGIECELEQL
jgi:hypothetical protein